MMLWLARHARPLVAPGVCYGASDVPADAAATQQAAQAIARTLPPGLVVRSSPLRRCVQLADALLALRPDLPYRRDARLAEMDFGCWEGCAWDAIAPDHYARWEADFAHHRFGGRESVTELMERVGAALAQARRSGRDTLWVTHAGVARALSLLAGGAAPPRSAADWPREGPAFGALCRCM